MPMDSELFLWLAGASVFILVFCIWTMGVVVWYLWHAGRSERVQQRLGLATVPDSSAQQGGRTIRLWRDGEAVATTVPNNPGMLYHMEQVRRELGWKMPVLSLIAAILGLSLLVTLLLFLTVGNLALAVAAGALVIIVPWMAVTRRIDQRNELFVSQFAEALGLATRSLRAGHPLPGAFRLVAEEMDPPVSAVFGEICQQQTLGVGMAEAIRNVAAKSTNADMKLFAAATVIQMKGGGNLADMMDRLQHVVRDRIRLHRKARTLTAEAQLSKRIMAAVPFVLFVLISVQNPDYMDPLLETRAGTILLFVAGVLLVTGVGIINHLARLKY